MIKFFRNIRQKLLAEGNTGKYLKYAIGEIFLVVVGILIALQINNWNEDHTLKNEIKKYKIALISDLAKDTLTLNKTINNLVTDTTKLGVYFKRMSNPEINVDTLKNIFKVYNPTIFGNIAFNKNTVNSLKSTGKITELEDWLQKDLIKLNELQENYYTSSKEDIRNYVDLFVLNNTKFVQMDHLNNQYNDKLSKIIWSEVDFSEFGGFLYKVFKLKYFVEGYTLNTLEKIQIETKALLYKLNTET